MKCMGPNTCDAAYARGHAYPNSNRSGYTPTESLTGMKWRATSIAKKVAWPGQWGLWWPGPRGIPGLNSNPDPGILENIILGFFGIYISNKTILSKTFLGFQTIFFQKIPGFNVWLIPSRKILGSHQSRDEKSKLIPSRKILGSRDFAKYRLVPARNPWERWSLMVTRVWQIYSNIQIFLIRRFIRIFVCIIFWIQIYSDIRPCQIFWYEYIRIFVRSNILIRIYSDFRSYQFSDSDDVFV